MLVQANRSAGPEERAKAIEITVQVCEGNFPTITFTAQDLDDFERVDLRKVGCHDMAGYYSGSYVRWLARFYSAYDQEPADYKRKVKYMKAASELVHKIKSDMVAVNFIGKQLSKVVK